MRHFTATTVFILLAALACSAVADLSSDMSDFQRLVPRRRIGYIAARHYVVNPQFRNALQYIRSAEFPDTWQQIRNTSEFDDIVSYMSVRGARYDVEDVIDRFPNRLRSFTVPAKVPVSMLVERQLSSFLSDAVNALPRARIANLMTQKVQEGGDFAKFYKTMRSNEFKRLVHKARKSRSLAAPLRKLNQNSIDVDNLISIGFSVLSWGP